MTTPAPARWPVTCGDPQRLPAEDETLHFAGGGLLLRGVNGSASPGDPQRPARDAAHLRWWARSRPTSCWSARLVEGAAQRNLPAAVLAPMATRLPTRLRRSPHCGSRGRTFATTATSMRPAWPWPRVPTRLAAHRSRCRPGTTWRHRARRGRCCRRRCGGSGKRPRATLTGRTGLRRGRCWARG